MGKAENRQSSCEKAYGLDQNSLYELAAEYGEVNRSEFVGDHQLN